MKKIMLLILALVLGLAACDALPLGNDTPSDDPAAVPPTAEVVVVTVEVTAPPNQAAPTPLTFSSPIPTSPPPTQAPPTQAAPAPAEPSPLPPTAPPAQPAVPAADSGPIQIDPSMYGPVFENISISGDTFSLRCNPREITFDLYSTDIYITQVELYFRIRDKHSEFIPAWGRAATLQTDGGNHFWLTYKGEDVKADARKAQGWYDFEFVGVNKYGDVVGRSKKIEGLVTYMVDCP